MTEGMEKQADFGFRRVALDDKQALVDDVFHKVARRYDLMNDLMSGGLHRAWKDMLVTAVNAPKSDRPFHLLDVAGGTADIAMRVVESGGAQTRASVLEELRELYDETFHADQPKIERLVQRLAGGHVGPLEAEAALEALAPVLDRLEQQRNPHGCAVRSLCCLLATRLDRARSA